MAQSNNADRPNLLGRDYGVELTISETSKRSKESVIDLSNFVKGVRVLHDMDEIWPEIYISIDIDALELITNDIYGQKTLKLKILRTNQDTDIKETVEIDLIIIESSISLTSKPFFATDGVQQIDLQTTTMLCVPLFAYNMMSSFVNAIVQESDPTTNGVDLLEKLIVDELGFEQRKVKIDKRGKNEGIISQIVVPPMTLKDAVRYINDEFYYYMGPNFSFCDIDGNFKMWNINEKMKDTEAMKVVLFPSTTDDPNAIQKILDDIAKEENIVHADAYTQTIYAGNAAIMRSGFDIVYTSHPAEDLYEHVIDDMDNAAKNFSTADPDTSQGLKIHQNLKNRKRYVHNNGGTGTTGSSEPELATSKISEDLVNLSGMSVTISGNLPLLNLFKIGEPAVFESLTMEYMPYGGKYLLWVTDISLSRETSDNWVAQGLIEMYRTNQSQLGNNDVNDRSSTGSLNNAGSLT